MNLGYFTMPMHPPGRPLSATLTEDREALLLADRLGFAEAFIGEHVADAAETVTSSLIFIASLAHDVRQMRLGTGTLNLPNGHPAAIAAQVAMVDHMLQGRFVMGIGPGGLASDMEVFENIDRDRTAMFVEAIDQILAIWSGEPPYDLEGRFWSISTRRTYDPETGVGVMPRPYQRPHPEIVCTALAPFSPGIAAAAARGWNPVSSNYLQAPWVASHWRKCIEGAATTGARPDPARWRVARNIFVSDDEATARRYAKSADGPYGFNLGQILRKLGKAGRLSTFKHSLDDADASIDLDYLLDRLVIAGTPDQVADQIVAFRREAGPFGTLLYAGIDWADPELAKRSMVLMAREVMPRVNARLASTDPEAEAAGTDR